MRLNEGFNQSADSLTDFFGISLERAKEIKDGICNVVTSMAKKYVNNDEERDMPYLLREVINSSSEKLGDLTQNERDFAIMVVHRNIEPLIMTINAHRMMKQKAAQARQFAEIADFVFERLTVN